MKFKVGDRVKVVKKGNHLKDIEVGDTGYIIYIDHINTPYRVKMDKYDDDYIACFQEDHIALEKYTFEDFKKAPVGTKVTFENGEILIKKWEADSEYENIFGNIMYIRNYNDLSNFKDNCGSEQLGKIIKIEEPTYTEVYNNKEEVKEMTLAEVCKELGYNIKIVKEEK